MYFPVVHGGRFDLIALRESAVEIRSSGKVIPVILPVATNARGLSALLRRYTRSGQPFCLVVNPICCPGTMAEVPMENLIGDALASCRTYFPTLMVNGATKRAQVDAFRARFPDHPLAFFHLDEIREPDALAAAAELGAHHLMETARRTYVQRFPQRSRVRIEDPFRKTRNAAYPPDETFSDTWAEYGSEGFAGFGDYQVIGRVYAPGGSTPRAVALHLTYRADDGAIRVRHFVSGPVAAPPEVAGRFLESVDALVRWADERGEEMAYSSALPVYRALRNAGEFPGLGVPKKLAIRHHVDLMISLL